MTDTVGFSGSAPGPCRAFRTTLDELRDGLALLHVVDASADDIDQPNRAVDDILQSSTWITIPDGPQQCDHTDLQEIRVLCVRYHARSAFGLDPDASVDCAPETLLPKVPSPPAPCEHPDQPPQDPAPISPDHCTIGAHDQRIMKSCRTTIIRRRGTPPPPAHPHHLATRTATVKVELDHHSPWELLVAITCPAQYRSACQPGHPEAFPPVPQPRDYAEG